MKASKIRISQELWTKTWSGLRERGAAKREALCVWAGDRQHLPWEVTDVIFLGDLPGVEGFALFHRISREAVTQLFGLLQAKGLDLIADVHTHPADWVGLSETDQEHPLEYRIGFISVVLPNYATSEPLLEAAGVHEYTGSMKWKTLELAETKERIQIGGV